MSIYSLTSLKQLRSIILGKQSKLVKQFYSTVSITNSYQYPPAHTTKFTTNQQVKQYQSNHINTNQATHKLTSDDHPSINTTTDTTATTQLLCQPSEFTSIKTGLLPATLIDIQNTFGTIHEIQQADQLCQSGDYVNAVILLKRAVEISVGLRDSLVAVYSHMLLARCYYLSNDLESEKYERNEIMKLLDQLIKEQRNKFDSNMHRKINSINDSNNKTYNLLNDTTMFKQSISSYSINLIRLHEYQSCIELLNTWSRRAEEYNAHDARIRAKAILGIIHMMQHNTAQAERCFEDMYRIAHDNMLNETTLVEGDSYVLLGLLYKYVEKNENKAKSMWQRAVKAYQSYHNIHESLDAGGVQLPVVYPLLYINTVDSVKQALDISERYLGITHWLTIDCLRALAGLYRTSDALTSEGLYRTCLNRVDSPAPYVQQAEYWYVLSDVLVDYADLLLVMKWNNQSRIAEANKLMERLHLLYQQHPHIQSTTRHVTFKQANDNDAAIFTLENNTQPFIPSWFYERFTA